MVKLLSFYTYYKYASATEGRVDLKLKCRSKIIKMNAKYTVQKVFTVSRKSVEMSRTVKLKMHRLA